MIKQCPFCDLPTNVVPLGSGECIHCGNEYKWSPTPQDLVDFPGLKYFPINELIWGIDLGKNDPFGNI